LRENPLKPRLAAGGIAVGTMAFEFFTSAYPAICAAAGAEFILYDMEHSGASFETMKAQFALCHGAGLVPLARVPADDYHFIARVLDIGAMGVMLPMVESADAAHAIVACTRYPPAGRRGAAFNVVPHDDYGPGTPAEKMAAAHARTLTICLVETVKGIENVDAIAAVDGVDIIWLGHFDLTSSMGIPGAFDDPRFHAAVDALLAACRRHGKTAGFLAGDDASAASYRAKGFRILAYGTDVTLLQSALARGLHGLAR
jgi:2-keto-3-deoxy-L-rhamnonate aldolase RhmA